MTIHHLTIEQLSDELRAGHRVPDWAVPGRPNLVLVDGVDGDAPALPGTITAVVVALSDDDSNAPEWCDVVASGEMVDRIERTVHANPLAATALAQTLRGSETRTMTGGLILESGVYSTLHAGPEFRAWRARTPRRERTDPDGPRVLVERVDDELRITLNRPHVHNALDARMHEELLAAFEPARLDHSLTVSLRGAGKSYSSASDLDDFDPSEDPAIAHLVRTSNAIGPVLAGLRGRAKVHLHGACLGSGIEIPAFAIHVVAAADVQIGIPELSLGLVPGAGGTWSMTQRIGRHRTAWLALTGDRIGLDTALDWGLVDAVDDMPD
jgi:enoyl-CoA hydratase/carnithine racemase